jgi:hypothetical protein
MPKARKHRVKEVKETEELRKIYEYLWHEISPLIASRSIPRKAGEKLREFQRTHNVKARERHIQGLR